MKAIFNNKFSINLDKPIDISIPLQFNDSSQQVNAFGAPYAKSTPLIIGSFTGNTRVGGAANCDSISIIPHCNGTHTECVGHISGRRISINDVLKEFWFPCTLISIKPEPAEKCTENYLTGLHKKDKVITEKSLRNAINRYPDKDFHKSVVIRTLSNTNSKLTQKYTLSEKTAYFTNDAMKFITKTGVEHLLVDLPTIDRLNDEGKLSNHHIFWNVPMGKFENKNKYSLKTITEFVYVPNSIPDGYYFLNLMIPSLMIDAAPSKPILYKAVKNLNSDR